MLQKQNRLTKKKDFDRVFKLGKSFFSRILGLKLAKNDLKVVRFGFVVSNKIAKRANKRNLLKRQLREIVRKMVKNSQIKPNLDIILIARQGILDKSYEELEQEVGYVFKKTGII